MSASEKERENMSLYSVLLVDDEEEVFQVIMKKLDWEGMGFRIAGYARNGVEALEMAEELSVDVVMTDIKMPYMDGLTLCRKLKEQYQKIKVIIFSGFDEFEYAREAIKIEAEESSDAAGKFPDVAHRRTDSGGLHRGICKKLQPHAKGSLFCGDRAAHQHDQPDGGGASDRSVSAGGLREKAGGGAAGSF